MGVLDTLERIFFPAPEGQTHTSYPLSGDSPELRALLAGNLNVASDGLAYVSEETAFSIPAFKRGVDLIAGTIAGLPLKTYRTVGDRRQQVPSIFDNPQGPFQISAYQWVEMVVLHLVAYQEAYLDHVTNNGGGLVGFWPVHPGAVTKVEWVGTQKRYTVHVGNSSLPYGTPDAPIEGRMLTQILGPSVGGLRGFPLWETNRRLFQIAVAAEQATARVFTGALIRGLVTTEQDEEVTGEEAAIIMEQLNQRISGPESANQFAFVNRHLKLNPWQQSNLDAQFIENRTMQIEEFARLLGLPPHLLAAIDKQTSWGTGIAEQNIGLSRYRLQAITSRIESALKPLNPDGEFQEFDYKGLLQGSPAQEVELLLAQVAGGILTPDEARAIMNLGPMPKTTEAETNGKEVNRTEDSQDS